MSKKYMVFSSETVFYRNLVEADSPEEAKELLLSGGYDLTAMDSCEFGVDDVLELPNE